MIIKLKICLLELTQLRISKYVLAILPAYPQHIVLGYVPKERVLKEFIKVRPKGFYFHD